MMFKGEQVRKVILLKKTKTYNAHNEEVETWAADTEKFPSGKVFMEWWDQGGREILQDGQLASFKDIRAKCHFIDGLNEKDYRIRKDSDDYDIESIKEINRREGQMLTLKLPDNA